MQIRLFRVAAALFAMSAASGVSAQDLSASCNNGQYLGYMSRAACEARVPSGRCRGIGTCPEGSAWEEGAADAIDACYDRGNLLTIRSYPDYEYLCSYRRPND